MLGEYMTLFTSSGYVYHSKQVCHGLFSAYKPSTYNTTLFIGIIWAETSLRSTVQRENALNDKIGAAKKLSNIDDSDLQCDQLEEELEEVKKTRAHQERDLYEKESMLPMTSLKKGYDSVKGNPAWYLQKELVEDCIGKGGCCSWDCGCCERCRSSAKKGKGIEHRTVECICCIHDRGFEFTAEEKKNLDDRFDRMLRAGNPAFFFKIANARTFRNLWSGKTRLNITMPGFGGVRLTFACSTLYCHFKLAVCLPI
ncbi:unnamed protein product [Penicillium egyptiacum]|uniref:Uncharacterized protein n=1 Tax=Penicillium egyptiacum TaxID=1303716 RepID=A0A9W4KBX2_9EURO|nr:unnamed protein product [Penicillium egyptiacum]